MKHVLIIISLLIVVGCTKVQEKNINQPEKGASHQVSHQVYMLRAGQAECLSMRDALKARFALQGGLNPAALQIYFYRRLRCRIVEEDIAFGQSQLLFRDLNGMRMYATKNGMYLTDIDVVDSYVN